MILSCLTRFQAFLHILHVWGRKSYWWGIRISSDRAWAQLFVILRTEPSSVHCARTGHMRKLLCCPDSPRRAAFLPINFVFIGARLTTQIIFLVLNCSTTLIHFCGRMSLLRRILTTHSRYLLSFLQRSGVVRRPSCVLCGCTGCSQISEYLQLNIFRKGIEYFGFGLSSYYLVRFDIVIFRSVLACEQASPSRLH